MQKILQIAGLVSEKDPYRKPAIAERPVLALGYEQNVVEDRAVIKLT
jgi:hypothetical protein